MFVLATSECQVLGVGLETEELLTTLSLSTDVSLLELRHCDEFCLTADIYKFYTRQDSRTRYVRSTSCALPYLHV